MGKYCGMIFYISCIVDFIAQFIPINKQFYLFLHI